MGEVIIKINGKPFLGTEVGNERGLAESAIFVTANAKTLAPVDKGQLKNSVMYKLDNGQTGGFNDGDGKPADIQLQSKVEKDSAIVGSHLDHAFYQEFGTRKMSAQPFLRPAGKLLNIDIAKKACQEEMAKALKKGVKVVKFSSVK